MHSVIIIITNERSVSTKVYHTVYRDFCCPVLMTSGVTYLLNIGLKVTFILDTYSYVLILDTERCIFLTWKIAFLFWTRKGAVLFWTRKVAASLCTRKAAALF